MCAVRVKPLISAAWLHQAFQNKGYKNIRVLDATWTITNSGIDHFNKEHIPKSDFYDINHGVRHSQFRPRELPDEHTFTEHMKSLQINPDSHVIFYDSANMVPASRAWMTLRTYGHDKVSVLDGGLEHWRREGYEINNRKLQSTTEKLSDHSKDSQFRVYVKRSLIRYFEDMLSLSQSGDEQILDARNPKHFAGLEEEPSPSTMITLKTMKYKLPIHMAKGHLPNSVNILISELLDNNLCLKNEEELKKVFADHGVDLSKPISTLCYNGNAASLLALAAAVCGNQAAVYFGSWTELGQRAQQSDLICDNIKERLQGA